MNSSAQKGPILGKNIHKNKKYTIIGHNNANLRVNLKSIDKNYRNSESDFLFDKNLIPLENKVIGNHILNSGNI